MGGLGVVAGRPLASAWECSSAAFVTALLALPMAPIAMRQIPATKPKHRYRHWRRIPASYWQAYIGGYAFDPAGTAGFAAWWLRVVLVLGATGIGVAAL